jgi:dipeptidase D
MTITNLEPAHLWKHFDEIRKIPHCSGNEEGLGNYVLEFAKKRKLEAHRDANGNILVRVPATSGHEQAPVVVLQGHLDMVGEKNSDVAHDFSKDPIQLRKDGDWLMAQGTTLGADNGIGLAAALAIVDSEDAIHGPLELLFTVDEEVGLTGAGKLEPSFLKGRLLLNLDSEELGAVYIGCSGGGDSTIHLPIGASAAPAGSTAVKVKVAGLRGGHSGIDINEQRGNAIQILARTLANAGREVPFALSGINGGNKRNAIPREAEATVTVKEADLETFARGVNREIEKIKQELSGVDPGLTVHVDTSAEKPGKVMDAKTRNAAINMLLAIPHGVSAMSLAVPGLVETSNNLATVATSADTLTIGTSSRSSVSSALQAVRDRIRSVGELAGADVEENTPYPGWKPDPNSKLLGIVKNAHKKLFGKEPAVKAIHAGLECGIIGEKFPGMEMVSFGPHIEHPHSPEERVNIPSVEKFNQLLRAVVAELAER